MKEELIFFKIVPFEFNALIPVSSFIDQNNIETSTLVCCEAVP